MLCEATKWTHLPVAGGWYDQHPKLVDRFYYLLAEKSKADEAEARRQQAEAQRGGPGGSRVAGRRRR